MELFKLFIDLLMSFGSWIFFVIGLFLLYHGATQIPATDEAALLYPIYAIGCVLLAIYLEPKTAK